MIPKRTGRGLPAAKGKGDTVAPSIQLTRQVVDRERLLAAAATGDFVSHYVDCPGLPGAGGWIIVRWLAGHPDTLQKGRRSHDSKTLAHLRRATRRRRGL